MLFLRSPPLIWEGYWHYKESYAATMKIVGISFNTALISSSVWVISFISNFSLQ